MADENEKIDPTVFGWANGQTTGFIVRATSLDQAAKMSSIMHVTKPWIKGFAGMAIAPLQRNLRDFLGAFLFSWREMAWYHPAARWWKSHAEVSHKGGFGCDVEAHVDFLTPGGKNAEFVYATVFWDGTVRVLEREDFAAECAFFKERFQRP